MLQGNKEGMTNSGKVLREIRCILQKKPCFLDGINSMGNDHPSSLLVCCLLVLFYKGEEHIAVGFGERH